MIKFTENGNETLLNESQILNTGLNKWTGWLCDLRNSNILQIYPNGDIYDAACLQGQVYTNIFLNNVSLYKPIKDLEICTQTACTCGNDLLIFKRNKTNTKTIINTMNYDYIINWLIVDVCNYKCSYCPPQLHSGKSIDNNKLEIGFNNFYRLFKDKKIFLNFLGGEPTLYKQLPEKIKTIKNLNNENKIIVTTNGSRDIEYLIELLKISNLSITVHLLSLSYNDLKLLANKINNLIQYNKKLHIQILYSPNTMKKLQLFLQTIKIKTFFIEINKARAVFPNINKELVKFTQEESDKINSLNELLKTNSISL